MVHQEFSDKPHKAHPFYSAVGASQSVNHHKIRIWYDMIDVGYATVHIFLLIWTKEVGAWLNFLVSMVKVQSLRFWLQHPHFSPCVAEKNLPFWCRDDLRNSVVNGGSSEGSHVSKKKEQVVVESNCHGFFVKQTGYNLIYPLVN